MNCEIVISPVEETILRELYEENKERLFVCWKVRDFGDFLHLLVMHGADCFDTLSFVSE